MKRFITIIIFFALFFPINKINAQENCNATTISDCENLYNIGRFNECINQLKQCLAATKGFIYEDKVQAYRLLSMSYLAIDSVETADEYIVQLLMLKDDFTADSRDPERFRYELNKVRSMQRIDIVSSVSKKAEDIRRAPATISVISKEEIIKRGYTDLIEVLADLPGFDISMLYGVNYANAYQRGLRTTTMEKTLLLIDGVEENDLWTNTADISRQYPITNIKRIEVIYGPASTMYGPNAFVGVINVITKYADDIISQGKNFGMHINTGFGSYNSKYADITMAYKKNIFSAIFTARHYASDRHDMSSQSFFDYNTNVYNAINYKSIMDIKTNAQSYINTNNLPANHPYYTIYSTAGIADSIVLTQAGISAARDLDKMAYSKIINGKKVGFANPTSLTLLNGKINVGDFSISMQHLFKNEAAGALYTDMGHAINNVYWIPKRTSITVSYERKISNKLTFSSLSNYRIHGIDNNTRVASVYNYSRKNLGIKDLIKDSIPGYNFTYFFQNNKQFRSEIKLLYTPTQHLYIIGGIEYRSSQLQGNYLNTTNKLFPEENGTANTGTVLGGNQYNINDIGFYTQANFRFAKYFGLTVGARIDNNTIRQHGGFGTEVSPRLVLDFSKNNWILKGIYSRGIMNVSNFTKFGVASGRIPNPNLGTESIKNFEIFISKKINQHITADVVFYNSIIKDVVGVKALTPTTSQNQNLGEFNIYGIQSNIHYKFKNVNFSINYTFTSPEQTVDDAGNATKLVVADIAKHHINAILNYTLLNKLNLNFRFNYVGKKLAGTGTTIPTNPEKEFPSYILSNATIGYTILKGTTLQLVCNNIFNKNYFNPAGRSADGINTPSSIIQPGRNFFIKLNYEF
jgi:outer membrane receptor for ferrienterochelin and colicins